MNTIKFNVEDSKVSEVLTILLNSGVAIKNVEVAGTQHSKTAMVSELCSVEDTGSSVTLYRHGTGSTEVISDVKPVGGTIFYIDDTADGEYQFFDVDGNLIENVQVGDRPYVYKVVSPGSKDKYYVYYDKLYEGLWAYRKSDDYALESLGTSNNVGSGKTNTEVVMAKDNGAYIDMDPDWHPTIWYQLQQARLTKVGGCDDWFVPSKCEIDELRLAIESGNITGGIIAGSSYEESIFTYKWIWSSV